MLRLREGAGYWNLYPDPSSSTFDQRLSYRLNTAFKAGIIEDPRYIATDEQRQKQYDGLLAIAGNTPVTFHENPYGIILVDRWAQNLSECHYDRGFVNLFRQVEAEGAIWPSDQNSKHDNKSVEIWELSTGSAAMGFGLATKMLGFEGRMFVGADIPEPRVQQMQSMGLTIERTPGYIKETREYLLQRIQGLKADGYKSVRWDRHRHNALAYEKGDHRVLFLNHSESDIIVDGFRQAAQELVDFFPEGEPPDIFVNLLGNFTSSTGLVTTLKGAFPNVRVISLEDMTNPNYFEIRYPERFKEIFGYEPTFTPPVVYGSSVRDIPLKFATPEMLQRIDEIRVFDPKEALAYMQQYNHAGDRSVADSIGRSSAACLMVAEQVARENPGKVIVTLNYDHGDRYEEFHQAFTPTMSFLDAVNYDRFEPSKVQPLQWKQLKPKSLVDTPRTLQEVYAAK